jgi:hypothetical protein
MEAGYGFGIHTFGAHIHLAQVPFLLCVFVAAYIYVEYILLADT